MKKPLLLVFCKNPQLGKVKTRLAADIGQENALKTYHLLLKRTADILRKLDIDIQLYYSENPIKNDVFDELKATKKKQIGSDLGERMHNAFITGFKTHSPVLIIGTDLWTIDAENIRQAIDALSHKEVVIGPATDGGYYLLGMKEMKPCLFENKKWGSDSVFIDTCGNLDNKQLYLLEEKNDIDTLQDLKTHPLLYQQIHE